MEPEESPQEPHQPPPPPPGPPPGPPPWEEPEGASQAAREFEAAEPHRAGPAADRQEISLSQRQIMGITGGLLLIVGVFLPIVSVPVVGGINVLTANSLMAGVLVLIGAYSAVRAFRDDFRFLTWNAYGGLLIIGFMAFLVFANAAAPAPAENAEETAMGEAMIQATTFEWGWIVLLLGAFFLIAAGHVHDDFRLRRRN